MSHGGEHIPPRSHGKRAARAEHSYIIRKALLPVERYLHSETAAAVMLLAAAVIAVFLANSPWSAAYVDFWKHRASGDFVGFTLDKDLRHWVNDGLMAIFFFLIGLEIKRELVRGELSSLRKAALPAIAALGGMIVPALLYIALNAGGEGARGWGIPMATDIAFTVGVLALLGDRIPSSLKVFLLTLAAVDDIGAILVIALVYTEHLSWLALAIAATLFGIMLVMRAVGFRSRIGYIVVGVLFWMAVLKSGVHATIAGVVLGLLTPATTYSDHHNFAQAATRLLDHFRHAISRGKHDEAEAILGQMEQLTSDTEPLVEQLERNVHPWVSYVVLPLFALANAGVVLSGTDLDQAMTNRVTLGIVIGLVLGKFTGILLFAIAAVKTRIATLPVGTRWSQIAGVATLAGIGFTVSLFITDLAFENDALIASAKLGIVLGSCLAAFAGYVCLRNPAVRHKQVSEH
jgi:NhaA family Na+:H+ antiporter